MTVNAPTVFPIRHDWAQPFKVTREWLTDVQTGKDGSEIRASLRSSPHITVQMHCQFLTEMGAGLLNALWRGASQPLRYYVPLWCDATELTSGISAGSSDIPCDTTDRPFLESGGLAMLVSEKPGTDTYTAEVVTVDVITDDDFSIVGTTANNYSAGPTKVAPCRVMWLTMPQNVAWENGRIASADLTFVEEIPQAAYQLSESTGTFTPASVAIVAFNPLTSIATGMAKIATLKAKVLDAAGMPGPATVVWSTSDAQITATPGFDTLTARAQKSSTFGAGGSITATVGALSDTYSF